MVSMNFQQYPWGEPTLLMFDLLWDPSDSETQSHSLITPHPIVHAQLHPTAMIAFSLVVSEMPCRKKPNSPLFDSIYLSYYCISKVLQIQTDTFGNILPCIFEKHMSIH